MEKTQQTMRPIHRSKEIIPFETHPIPRRCKLEELSEKIEGWMGLVNRYESRKPPTGTRQDLADDIKMSILEGMCPAEVERHLQLNRSKFPDFDDMHSELATYWKPALV